MDLSWLLFLAIGALLALVVNWAADALPDKLWHSKPRLWDKPLGRPGVVSLICLAGAPSTAAIIGTHVKTMLLLVWGALFLLVAVIDVEHRRVLNVLMLAAAALALLCSLAGWPLAPHPLDMLIGGVIGLLLFLLIAVVGRGAMGAGDVKLAAVIGLVVGYPQVITALFIGVLTGGLVALLALLQGSGRKGSIPYAPGLVVGVLVALLQTAMATPL